MGVGKGLVELLENNLKTFQVPEGYADFVDKLQTLGPNRAKKGSEVAIELGRHSIVKVPSGKVDI